jgi:hypothetical protein
VHEPGYRRPASQSLRGTGVELRPQQPRRTPIDTQMIAIGPASKSQSPRTPHVVNTYSAALLDLFDPTGLFLSAYRQKSMERFMNAYSPKTDMRSTTNEGKIIVDLMPQLSGSDEALRLAVLAIGTIALSQQNNDVDLARQGRSLYGRALIETRRALQHPVRCMSTAIIAIPHVSKCQCTGNATQNP